MDETQSLWALFISGFISATLLPGGSEALLAWQLSSSEYNSVSLWAAATAGNSLGGIVTFLMGWGIATYRPLRTLEQPQHEKAKQLIERYGAFSLLLSWVPLLGDPLCLVAGWLKTHLILSMLMIVIGKAIRYLLIVGIV